MACRNCDPELASQYDETAAMIKKSLEESEHKRRRATAERWQSEVVNNPRRFAAHRLLRKIKYGNERSIEDLDEVVFLVQTINT